MTMREEWGMRKELVGYEGGRCCNIQMDVDKTK